MTRALEVTNELRRIAAENGGILRPADVVEEAASAASPLHFCFEWDDSEAAYLYRLQQARALIRVTVETLSHGEKHYRVRTFVSLMEDRVLEAGGYRVMAEILSSPQGRAQLLHDALREMNHFKVKYHELSELAQVFAAMERSIRIYGEGPPTPRPPSGGGTNDMLSP